MYFILPLTLSALLISNTRAQLCPNTPDSAVVGLKVQYDLTPEETLLQIITFSGSIATTNITLNPEAESNAYKEANVCLGRNTLTEVLVKDSGRNGFFGSGYAAVSVNERLIATVSDFGEEARYMFYADKATCNNGEIPFVLDIKYDSSPGSTSWTLTDKETNTVVISNGNVGNVNYLSNKFLTVSKCVSVDKTYQFSITNDEGFNAPAFYRIFSDYDLIKVGEGFTGTETQEFTLDGSTTPIPITVSPTPAPVIVDPNGCADDFSAKFTIDDGTQHPCVYLDSREEERLQYCENADAKAACPHTCGQCQDNCDDEDGKFSIGGRSGYTCNYVRVRLTANYDRYIEELCNASNSEAGEKCKKSCLKCSA